MWYMCCRLYLRPFTVQIARFSENDTSLELSKVSGFIANYSKTQYILSLFEIWSPYQNCNISNHDPYGIIYANQSSPSFPPIQSFTQLSYPLILPNLFANSPTHTLSLSHSLAQSLTHSHTHIHFIHYSCMCPMLQRRQGKSSNWKLG